MPKPASDSCPTLHAYAAVWLANLTGSVRPQTLTGYRVIVTRWLPKLADVPLDQLTRASVRTWLAELLTAGLAPQTVGRAHSVLHALLNVALDDGLIAVNVSQGLARRLHRSVRPRTTLDLAQLDLFLDAARPIAGPRRWPLFVALCAGGLRVGEACALRPEDVHPVDAVLRIERNVRSGGHIGPPKSGRPRTVIITATAADILRDVPRHRSGWLFPARRGPHPVSAEHVRKLTRAIAIAAGLPATVSPRTFRRSYAAVMKRAGVSVAFTADQFGHASEATTRTFYLDGAPRAEVPAILRRA